MEGTARRWARLGLSLTLGAGLALTGALVALSATPPTAGAASKASTIVVGDVCSCTGPEASSVSQTTPTMQAWAKYVDSHGGIAGHQVKLVVMDDGYNPGTSLTDVENMVTGDHIVALFDNSDVDTAWSAYVEQHQIPVLGGQVSAEGYVNPMFFVPGATYNYFPDAIAALARDEGVKKLADLYCAEVAVCQQSSVGLKTAMTKVGAQLAYTTAISFAAPNFTAPCLASEQSGATGMVVGDATAIVNKVVQDCTQQNYKPKQLSGDGTVAISWLTIPGMNGNADVQENVPWFVHNAATNPMYAALAKYAPGVTTSPNFGEIVIEDWAAGALLQAAGATGKLSGSTVTSTDVASAMYALPKGDTLGGLAPPLTFTKGKASNNDCYFHMGIENGKFVELDGGKVTCQK